MCGIIGYIGNKEIIPLLIDGLKRLEYRGYDSAGIAVLDGDNFFIHKCQGKICDLEASIGQSAIVNRRLNTNDQITNHQTSLPREMPHKMRSIFHRGRNQHPEPSTIHDSPSVGLGHTRWATHGKPSDANAHPHADCEDKLVVVHNGIIENYMTLKQRLISEGHRFLSETDTEVIAHLIEHYLNGDLERAVLQAMREVEGSYAVGVIWIGEQGQIVAARKDSPLIVGCGDGEGFIASDVPAILRHTKDVIYLEDGEMAVLEKEHIRLIKMESDRQVKRASHRISWDAAMAEKGGYKHYMLKEIHEQPRAIEDTFRGRILSKENRVILDEIRISVDELSQIEKIFIVACGTSHHAALVGKFMLEKLANVPVEVDIASEFRYRSPIIREGNLTLVISQSGETADTLAGLREARSRGSRIISICNCVGSSVTRESDGVIYTHAGPEIGVASTKAFTCQITALYLFTLYLAEIRKTMEKDEIGKRIEELFHLPLTLNKVLAKEQEIQKLARRHYKKKDLLFLGRSLNYPIALEGALKLKEISYIHAEGYPAGEMKHGPIALIDERMPVVVLATRNGVYEKILGNIEEVKARRGEVIAVATEGDEEIQRKSDHVIFVPRASEEMTALMLSIPLQLFAYHMADLKGCDVDQPRNLAKSVTVE